MNGQPDSQPSAGRSQQVEDRFNAAPDDRKLFVGGLSWNTTDEDLLRYFARFGAVDDAAMKRDRMGMPRGFAFIVYMEPSSVDKVMEKPEHILNGRKIDPKRARSQKINTNRGRPNKVFVKNSKACSEEELREHFGQFGEIINIDLPVYTNDDKSFSRREYCFIEFESEESAINAAEVGSHTIGATTVEAKRFDAKQSGAAASKGGPPDVVRMRRQQRFSPYDMGGPQNMNGGGGGFYPQNPQGFMNNYDGGPQMNNFMGAPYQSQNMHPGSMGMRNQQMMGNGSQFGNMGVGGGMSNRYNGGGGGQFNGFGDSYVAPMQNQQFGGSRGMNFGGNMGNPLPNNYIEMQPSMNQAFMQSPPNQSFPGNMGNDNYMGGNNISHMNRNNSGGNSGYAPRRGGFHRGGPGNRFNSNSYNSHFNMKSEY